MYVARLWSGCIVLFWHYSFCIFTYVYKTEQNWSMVLQCFSESQLMQYMRCLNMVCCSTITNLCRFNYICILYRIIPFCAVQSYFYSCSKVCGILSHCNVEAWLLLEIPGMTLNGIHIRFLEPKASFCWWAVKHSHHTLWKLNSRQCCC